MKSSFGGRDRESRAIGLAGDCLGLVFESQSRLILLCPCSGPRGSVAITNVLLATFMIAERA